MAIDTPQRWARFVLTGGDATAAESNATEPTDAQLAPLVAECTAALVETYPCLGSDPSATLTGADAAHWACALGRTVAAAWQDLLADASTGAGSRAVAQVRRTVKLGPVTEETGPASGVSGGLAVSTNLRDAARALRRIACVRAGLQAPPDVLSADGPRRARERTAPTFNLF